MQCMAAWGLDINLSSFTTVLYLSHGVWRDLSSPPPLSSLSAPYLSFILRPFSILYLMRQNHESFFLWSLTKAVFSVCGLMLWNRNFCVVDKKIQKANFTTGPLHVKKYLLQQLMTIKNIFSKRLVTTWHILADFFKSLFYRLHYRRL